MQELQHRAFVDAALFVEPVHDPIMRKVAPPSFITLVWRCG